MGSKKEKNEFAHIQIGGRMKGGFCGASIFFVLTHSGFLVTYILFFPNAWNTGIPVYGNFLRIDFRANL